MGGIIRTLGKAAKGAAAVAVPAAFAEQERRVLAQRDAVLRGYQKDDQATARKNQLEDRDADQTYRTSERVAGQEAAVGMLERELAAQPRVKAETLTYKTVDEEGYEIEKIIERMEDGSWQEVRATTPGPGGGSYPTPSQGAIDLFMANSNDPEVVRQFTEKYGEQAAGQYLSGDAAPAEGGAAATPAESARSRGLINGVSDVSRMLQGLDGGGITEEEKSIMQELMAAGDKIGLFRMVRDLKKDSKLTDADIPKEVHEFLMLSTQSPINSFSKSPLLTGSNSILSSRM
jgi:hypothetical protein